MIRITGCFLIGLLVCVSARATDYTEAERLFTLKVGPVFAQKCNGCHGKDPDDVKGGFNMLSLDSLLRGGEEIGAEVLKPGDAAHSFLMTTIRWEDADFEMPPKKNDRLTEEEIAQVEKWINAGAPWPGEEVLKRIREDERRKKVTEDGMIIETSGGTGDQWTYRRYNPEEVWAFQPVETPEVPKGAAHPVDAFVYKKLRSAGFDPAPTADPRTLIRRATYDLTGLPPTPAETHAFIEACKTDAEKAWLDLIDRLLDSPHYGERWAQHWLDVVRYADTGGFSNDYERSNAWRYRDYVIRSLNGDKRYDQFVMEQIAGDEMDPDDPEMLVATGFLRMGPFDNAMVKIDEARQLYLDDVVNGVGQTFLSTTMRCFKCHDHKFDPLPTRDYYRMYAAFSTTQLAERDAPFLENENKEGFDAGRGNVKRLLDFATRKKNELVEKREAAARKWYAENNREYKTLDERKDDADEDKPERHCGLDHVEAGRLKVREQDEWIWNRRLERYEPMAQSVYNGPVPKWLSAKKLRMPGKVPSAKPDENHILVGGALSAKGDKVTPGVLSALGVPVEGAPADDPYRLPETVSGRRLALAKWVADPRNPLTTRSIVNRIWQHHFGKGIVGTPSSFSVKGARPTHPALLDWLTTNFVENGWTMKRMHRLIMTSKTYRQSSIHPRYAELATKDPDNDLFGCFPVRRLTAEELRDSLLSFTGELNRTIGGLPVMPEINMEVALQPRMIQFSIAPAYLPSPTPAERNRRSIYAYRVRGQADPFTEIFNQPNPNESCDRRDTAAVTPQVFTLMNSDVVTDRSIAFALRLRKEAADLEGQIARAFHLMFSRQPEAGERGRLFKYVREMTAFHEKSRPEAPEYPVSITRSLVEEFSGRPFEYEEILPVFERYTPDRKASDADAETLALADVCLLLFNLNEFMYIY